MGSRDELGAADVSDQELATMVASHLGQDSVVLLESRVDPVDYDLPAITTGGRWWVSGHAETECGRVPFRFFVKQVQSWERHPLFAYVPEEFRELAVAGVPWKTEAEVYRSDFARRLPPGLSAPRALGVFDLDAGSSAIWIEEVPIRPANWDRQRYERAAHLLGRLSASRELAPLAGLRDVDWSLTMYANGRLAVRGRGGASALPYSRSPPVSHPPTTPLIRLTTATTAEFARPLRPRVERPLRRFL